MRRSRLLVVSVLALAITGVAAGRQLAMLVEVTPQRAVEGGTLTEIVVRVAPEDRAALGKDVMLWVELSREEVRVLRRGWALKIDDPAEPLEAEIVIPDGPHVLRVDLKGVEGRSTGVWWGDVDVSVSSPSPSPSPLSESVPVPVPVPDVSEQRQQTATAAGAAAATVAVPDSDPIPVPDDSERRQQPAAAPAAATATEAATGPAPEPEPAPNESGKVTAQSSPIPYLPYSPGRDELTVIVTRGGAAVRGLTSDNFAVTAGGEELPIAYVEGPGNGFANLGIAVDLDEATSAEMDWVSVMVSRLAELVNPRPGFTIVGDLIGCFSSSVRFDPDDPSGPSGWMVDAEHAAPMENLPRLILSSLDSAKTTRGKSFLVVVTDGRGSRNPKAWKGVHEAAAKAGVPVFIVGIWREDFGSGLRKDLRKLAAASGGAAFYVQGPLQVDDLIERFGAEIDGAYSVVVESLEMPGRVVAAVVGIDADVRSAAAIRWSKSRYDFEGDRIRGMFVYFADAANFTECTTGRKFPVAMEADYLAAERSYLESRSGPWASLIMTIEGRVEIRSHMERGFVNESIIIDRFIAVHPDEGCK